MTLRSVLKYEGISTLILNIDVRASGVEEKGFRKKIIEAIQYDWEAHEADVAGNVLSFSAGDYGDEQWRRACQARQWRSNFAMRLTDEDALFIQTGSRSGGSEHRVRLVFDNFSAYVWPDPFRLLKLCGESGGFSPWRVTIEELHASFALKGLKLDDVRVAFEAHHQQAVEAVVSASGAACGYQFGRRLGKRALLPSLRDGWRYQVKSRYGWNQDREVAIRNRRPEDGELPAIEIDYALPRAVTLQELEESASPLAGLKVFYSSGAAEGEAPACWAPLSAWGKMLQQIRNSGFGTATDAAS